MTTGDLGRDSSYIELIDADGQSTSISKSRDRIDWLKLLAVSMSIVQGYNVFSHVSSVVTLSQSIHFLVSWYRYYIGLPFRWLNLNISPFDQDLIVLIAIAYSAASYSWKQNYGVSILNYWVPKLESDQSPRGSNERPTGLIISTYRKMNKLSVLIGFVIGVSSFFALLYLIYNLDKRIVITADAILWALVSALSVLILAATLLRILLLVKHAFMFVFFRDAYRESSESRARELAQLDDTAGERGELHRKDGLDGDDDLQGGDGLDHNEDTYKKEFYKILDEIFELNVFQQMIVIIYVPLHFLISKCLKNLKAISQNGVSFSVILSAFRSLFEILFVLLMIVILPAVVISVYAIFGLVFFTLPYWIIPFYLAVMIGTRPIAVMWMVGAVAGLIMLSHLFTYIVDPYVIPYLQNLPKPPS